MSVDFKTLSAEEKEQLKQQLLAEDKAKAETRKNEVMAYHALKYITVDTVFQKLTRLSSQMQLDKSDLLSEFKSLLETKNELYGVKEDQLSHNWTSEDNERTIITGYNVVDSWDETVSVGITKVNAWIESKLNDHNQEYIGIIRDLLKPNKEGVLKASRVLDLQNHAEKSGDEALIDAVKIIREAHRPVKTGTYIKAKYKDEDGNWQWLGLSMSAV